MGTIKQLSDMFEKADNWPHFHKLIFDHVPDIALRRGNLVDFNMFVRTRVKEVKNGSVIFEPNSSVTTYTHAYFGAN